MRNFGQNIYPRLVIYQQFDFKMPIKENNLDVQQGILLLHRFPECRFLFSTSIISYLCNQLFNTTCHSDILGKLLTSFEKLFYRFGTAWTSDRFLDAAWTIQMSLWTQSIPVGVFFAKSREVEVQNNGSPQHYLAHNISQKYLKFSATPNLSKLTWPTIYVTMIQAIQVNIKIGQKIQLCLINLMRVTAFF